MEWLVVIALASFVGVLIYSGWDAGREKQI